MDLVKFTEEVLDEKLHFLCSVNYFCKKSSIEDDWQVPKYFSGLSIILWEITDESEVEL